MKKTSAEQYILTADELRRLQLVLLEMLLEIDKICRKNNIRYIIDGGTLLGAVRHGGFIPWDDDLDVVMTRGEYERFRAVCETDLDCEKYFFQDNTTDAEYRWGYGKLRRKNSEFLRHNQEHLKMKTGIFLDIFPRDNVPDSKVSYFFHNIYCYTLRKLLYARVGMVVENSPAFRLWYRLLNLIPHSFAFKKIAKLSRKSNKKEARRMRTLTFPMLRKGQFGYERRWFEQIGEIEFEGHTFPCPQDYDGYLKELYGDYMTPPPEDKRGLHPVSKFKLPED